MSTGELLSIEPIELKFPCECVFSLSLSLSYGSVFCFLFIFFGFCFCFLMMSRVSFRCFICFCFDCFCCFLFCLFPSFFFFFKKLVELRKQISCSLQLSNKTDNYVAFKVNLFNFCFPRCINYCCLIV